VEQIPSPREHRNVRTLAREGLGRCEPHARGGAADDGCSIAKPEVHDQLGVTRYSGTADLLPDAIVLVKSAPVGDGIAPDV
jgi:hypothetical protein